MNKDTNEITAEAIANTYLVPTVSYAFQPILQMRKWKQRKVK